MTKLRVCEFVNTTVSSDGKVAPHLLTINEMDMGKAVGEVKSDEKGSRKKETAENKDRKGYRRVVGERRWNVKKVDLFMSSIGFLPWVWYEKKMIEKVGSRREKRRWGRLKYTYYTQMPILKYLGLNNV